MRIAFDYQTFCLQSYGGISRYFVRLAKELIEAKQDVGIFAPLHRNHYVRFLSNGVVHGFGLNRYPPKSTRLILPINRLLAKPAIQKWRPHVVHETYYSRHSSAPESCSTVITVYDMIHELFSDQFSSHDKTSILKRMAVDRADHVICISENTRRDLLNLFNVSENKLSVVHLGFDLFDSNSMPAEEIQVPTKPYLLYVGNRGGYKNFLGFLCAVASSRRLKSDFDIIAFGGGGFTGYEADFLSQLRFNADQVRQISGDDTLLKYLYIHAQAFVFPSLYEGFGIPPLEAMAHQCPVISSKTSSMPEVIGDAGEFFDPRSIEDMAFAIERVVYSPSRTQELIERGKRRLALFSWKRCAEQTLNIYRRLDVRL
jgi:glycosyltransferase involved in cell wall biosynthesis